MGAHISMVDTDTRLKIGTWENKVENTVYQAPVGGRAIVIWMESGESWVLGRTDGDNPPAAIRMRGDTRVYGGIVVPVAKGDYWKIESDSEHPVTVFWLPWTVDAIK